MEKNILVTDNGKVLVRVIISHDESMISLPSMPSTPFLKPYTGSIYESIKKFMAWQKKFFNLEGFDSYNDPRF